MILLTGATGAVGKRLLALLLDRGEAVRCLVREPRRLGSARVAVSIAIGDLGDRHAFDTALRGVDTVIHLASATRDQRGGSIEELNALATHRLVAAVRERGVERFAYIAPAAAARHSRVRFYRSAALAEQAIRDGGFDAAIFAASMIYAADDRYLGTIARWSHVLPAVPVLGGRDTEFEPVWAGDAAAALARVVCGDVEPPGHASIELAGPQVLSNEQILRITMRERGRRRPLVAVPERPAKRVARWARDEFGPSVPVTEDEIDLLSVTSRSIRGTADLAALGIRPANLAQGLQSV